MQLVNFIKEKTAFFSCKLIYAVFSFYGFLLLSKAFDISVHTILSHKDHFGIRSTILPCFTCNLSNTRHYLPSKFGVLNIYTMQCPSKFYAWTSLVQR